MPYGGSRPSFLWQPCTRSTAEMDLWFDEWTWACKGLDKCPSPLISVSTLVKPPEPLQWKKKAVISTVWIISETLKELLALYTLLLFCLLPITCWYRWKCVSHPRKLLCMHVNKWDPKSMHHITTSGRNYTWCPLTSHSFLLTLITKMIVVIIQSENAIRCISKHYPCSLSLSFLKWLPLQVEWSIPTKNLFLCIMI